jgi:outer membrane protein assembly factor BamA
MHMTPPRSNLLKNAGYFLLVSCAGGLSLMPRASAETPQKMAITGHTKSQESFIRDLAERCLAETPAEKRCQSTADLRQCLLNSRLFTQVQAACNQNHELSIEVEDRWTLLAVPFASIDSDRNKQYGAAVVDSNFLGLGKFILLAGNASASRTNYIVSFSDPSFLGSRFSVGISINRAHGDIYQLARDRSTELDGFEENRFVVAPALGYHFNSHLGISFNGRYMRRDYYRIKDFELPQNITLLAAGTTLRFNYSDYKIYFDDGFFGHVTFASDIQRRGDSLKTNYRSVSLSYQKNIWLNHAAQLTAAYGELKGGNKTDLMRLSSQRGSRGLPSGATWVKAYQNIAFDYQIPLAEFSTGVWTLAPFADAGTFDQHLLRQQQRYTTRGIATYFYLRRVTAPGLGFEYGTNSAYKKSFASFTIGVSMG